MNYFSDKEIMCRCGCGTIIKQQPLIDFLNEARHTAGFPFVINSWTRCAKHNAEVGGNPNSAHLRGWATDVRCLDAHTRFILVDLFLSIGAKRLEVMGGWVHIDLDPSLPQGIISVGE